MAEPLVTPGLYLGDARALTPRLPDASVDLILTDPVYAHHADYVWLAEQAARVLTPTGNLLAFCSLGDTAVLRPAMAAHLNFVWELSYIIKAKTTRLFAYNLFTWNTPCLWFARGKGRARRPIPDVYLGNNGPVQGGHKWNKNLGVLRYWIAAFTAPGAVVLDPFCGGGSTLVAAKETGRCGVGFDRDPEALAEARQRVADAQPPLLVTDGETYQLALWE